MVKKTLESKWATFRYVIEKKHNTKVLNKPNNNIRITEQKNKNRGFYKNTKILLLNFKNNISIKEK